MNGRNNLNNFLFSDVADFDMIEAESPIILKVAAMKELEEANYIPVGEPIRVRSGKYVLFLVRYQPYSYEA
jgi:hypothetical protein